VQAIFGMGANKKEPHLTGKSIIKIQEWAETHYGAGLKAQTPGLVLGERKIDEPTELREPLEQLGLRVKMRPTIGDKMVGDDVNSWIKTANESHVKLNIKGGSHCKQMIQMNQGHRRQSSGYKTGKQPKLDRTESKTHYYVLWADRKGGLLARVRCWKGYILASTPAIPERTLLSAIWSGGTFKRDHWNRVQRRNTKQKSKNGRGQGSGY